MSSHDDWQRLQIDLGCVGELSGISRMMTRNGRTSGDRGSQGEAFSFSVDGVNWTYLTEDTSSGWEAYNFYSTRAWNSVDYGWSLTLTPTPEVLARYVRFHWDGASDAVNEIDFEFTVPAEPLTLDVSCRRGFVSCDAVVLGGIGPFDWNWTAGPSTWGLRASSQGPTSSVTGSCNGQRYSVQVSVTDRETGIGLSQWAGSNCER